MDKESALVQANVRVNLGRQEVMEQRSEMDKYKFNYHTEHQKCLTQEKRLKELEASVEKQNAELHELRLKVSQSVPASDQETRVIKAQLQKALIDKNAIKAQLEAKELDNKQLSAMCDELLQSMEASKS